MRTSALTQHSCPDYHPSVFITTQVVPFRSATSVTSHLTEIHCLGCSSFHLLFANRFSFLRTLCIVLVQLCKQEAMLLFTVYSLLYVYDCVVLHTIKIMFPLL